VAVCVWELHDPAAECHDIPEALLVVKRKRDLYSASESLVEV
jgi:hypothetical protein